jgi:hypothetical protein
LTEAVALRKIAELQHSSLPGLTRQSILFVKTFLFLMDARVKPGDDDCKVTLLGSATVHAY